MRYRLTAKSADGSIGTYIVKTASRSKARKCVEDHGLTVLDDGSKVRWKLDEEGLAEVCKLLKIYWPVKVRRTSSSTNVGKHTLRRYKGSNHITHSITVNKALSPVEASMVLWHELCHAMQAEEASRKLPANATGNAHMRAWGESMLRSRDIPYDERPIEIEALSYEIPGQLWLLALPI